MAISLILNAPPACHIEILVDLGIGAGAWPVTCAARRLNALQSRHRKEATFTTGCWRNREAARTSARYDPERCMTALAGSNVRGSAAPSATVVSMVITTEIHMQKNANQKTEVSPKCPAIAPAMAE